MKKKVLIITEPNFKEISELMTNKAMEVLEKNGHHSFVITAPDISEIPTVLRYYLKAMELRTFDERSYAYVILGCNKIDKKEQTITSIKVEQELENFKLQHSLALSYAIFTPSDMNKVIDESQNIAKKAALRCVELVKMKKYLGL